MVEQPLNKKRIWGLLASAAFLLALSLTRLATAAEAPVFELKVSPEAPTAGDQVTFSVEPQNFAATSTYYAWFRDDIKLVSMSGLGRSSLVLTTDPEKPELIKIKVTVGKLPDFEPSEKTATVYTLPNIARAEEALASIASDFTLKVSNPNPDPGEIVNFEVVTFAFERAAASYEWYVNGARQKEVSGRGRYQASFPSGKDGEVKTVRVTVTTPSGSQRTKSLTVRTLSASIYWWTETSVPYWYRGKALPTLNSRVTITALPSQQNPRDISYQWQFNGSNVPRASGPGRSTFTFTMALPVEEKIDAVLKNASGTLAKSVATTIKPVLPTVNVYQSHPLQGILSSEALTSIRRPAGESLNFLAVPFFFPAESVNRLRYLWTLNGQTITGEFEKPWLFTLRSKTGETSANNLDVEVSDPDARGQQKVPASLRVNLQ